MTLATDYLGLDALLSAAELAWRDTVRTFVTDRIRPNITAWYESAVFPAEIVPEMGRLGLLGAHLSGYGCPGRSAVEYGLAALELEAGDSGLRTFVSVQGSLAMSAIHKFGTEAHKERWLPGMAAGDLIGCFGLTEPEAGSDPASMTTTARRVGDGWVIDGAKRWIGNGCRGDVLTVFARAEVDGKDSHIALILEKGMDGFDQSGPRYETMGLKGNHLCPVRFNDVRVPPENILGEPGEGFHIAMQVLNNGRIGLGTGSVGLAKRLLDLAIEHVTTRRQFGKTLSEFDMVEEKIGWMVSYLFGLESLAYLTTGMVDNGIEDYSVESAIAKISGTEFVWYQANRALQLAGGLGYMRDQPYEQILRDIRIFPIFEGANDVMRSFVALSALKPLGEELEGLGDLGLSDPIGSIGAIAEYAFGRVKREIRPDRVSRAHEELSSLADSVGDQVKRLRGEGEGLLRKHGKAIVDQGLSHRRYCDALSDIYAQIAVLSRVTAIFEEQGVEASGQERYIAETFCRRAGARVDSALDGLHRNDDDRMHSIATLAYKRGAYGYALFED
jgi:acyl-CoA dehydrogenase family protein 9